MAFQIPPHLIIKETGHWIVNHRVGSHLPGYLMVGSRMETTNLFDLPPAALAELGPLLALAQQALLDLFRPEQLYLGRYGHMTGFSIHFHVIPIQAWVREAFEADSRYRSVCTDGAGLTHYIWREFCESETPPRVYGPSVTEVVDRLRPRFAAAPIDAI